MKHNKDFFSHCAQLYQKYRIQYPDPLFEFIKQSVNNHHRVWDVGTGNGQTALKLTDYFDQVIASDISPNQIKHAFQHKRIQYQLADINGVTISPKSLDAITVSQAVHWFDLDKFSEKIRYSLKPNGVVAIWCYTYPQIEKQIDNAIVELFEKQLRYYWPRQIEHVFNHYETIDLPFKSREKRTFYVKTNWSRDDLENYLATTSPVTQFIREHQENPLKNFIQSVSDIWTDPLQPKQVIWPIYLTLFHQIK